ncbi:unnamed protein product [Mortierella alpina]
MLHFPITTSTPLMPSSGCNHPSISLQGKTASPRPSSALGLRPSRIDVKSQSYDSRQSRSAAINIPSPPLTPYLGRGDDDDVDDDAAMCLSRHRSSNERTKEKREPLFSTTTCSTVSPRLRQRSASMSSVVPSLGFTFSTNLSPSQPKEDRESYAFFLKKMEADYWKSVSTIRSTYFFDGIGRGGGFLAVGVLFVCPTSLTWAEEKNLCDPVLTLQDPLWLQ